MALDTLPQEILRNIISCHRPKRHDLFNYSLTCRSLWDAATSDLYANIDFTIDEEVQHNAKASKKTTQRQIEFLVAIASNPELGARVRTFKNHTSWLSDSYHDVTRHADPQLLTDAAENITLLSKASFTEGHLALSVIRNLAAYTQLTELTLILRPEDCPQSIFSTSLKKLEWKIPSDYGAHGSDRDQNPWNQAAPIIKLAAALSVLEELDISFCGPCRHMPKFSPQASQLNSELHEAPSLAAPKFMRLQHFGFNFPPTPRTSQHDLVRAAYLDFIVRHTETLTSLSVPIGYRQLTRQKLDFILKAVTASPKLKSLKLVQLGQAGGQGNASEIRQLFAELISTLASPKYEIERFEIADIGVPFSPKIGSMFAPWKSLKFLKMGDACNRGGPYGDDGRPDFWAYGPQITECITSLPPSIEEVYLEINGERLSCDEDSDFDPICGLAPELFGPESPLKNLHTCDIHAWISSIDGGLGQLPEKAVFYRRLPCEADPTNGKKRDVWTSRMDCAHQGDWDWVITRECKELEGDFEGVDAEEIWLGGFVFEPPKNIWREGGTWRKPNYSWPGYVNVVNGYSMFREGALSGLRR